MTRRPAAVRHVKHRAIGSGTRLRDEVSMPMSLYYGSRLLRAAFSDRWKAAALVLFVVLWMLSGSLAIAAVGWCVFVALGLTGWLGWRMRLAGGESLSLREAVREAVRKETLRRKWQLACESERLLGIRTGEPPRLRRIKNAGPGSLTAVVHPGAIGVSVAALSKAAGTLPDYIGCREVVVHEQAPGVAKLAFHWSDPISRILRLTELPPAPAGHLAYGIRQDGSVASVKATQSILIGGLTRSGKSNLVWSLLADALRQGMPVHLYVSDPKGGVELDALEQLLDNEVGLLKVRAYAKNAAETIKMLDRVDKAMQVRQRQMKEKGTRQVQPSKENPLVVVILDETLPLAEILKKGADSPLGRLAYTGAAAAYVVWANSQVAQVDTIGRVRDLIPQRICFATPNPQVTDSVLGQGAETSGAKCSEIPHPGAAGTGYSYIEGDRQARKFRAALVSDSDVKSIATGRLPQKVMDSYTQATTLATNRKAHAVYWYLDPEDRPVYIGETNDPERRHREHTKANKPWMAAVARRDVQWFPSKEAACKVEKEQIETWRPPGNREYNAEGKGTFLAKVMR